MHSNKRVNLGAKQKAGERKKVVNSYSRRTSDSHDPSDACPEAKKPKQIDLRCVI